MAVQANVNELTKTNISAGVAIDCAMQCYNPAWIAVYYSSRRLKAVYGIDYTVSLALDQMSFTLTPAQSLLTKMGLTSDASTIYVVRETPPVHDFTVNDAYVRESIVNIMDVSFMALQYALGEVSRYNSRISDLENGIEMSTQFAQDMQALYDDTVEATALTAADRVAVSSAKASVDASAAQAAASAVAAQAAAATAGANFNVVTTWAALSGISGTINGQSGEVLPGDNGTHQDPVTLELAVPNAGGYQWVAATPGWKRTGPGALATEIVNRIAGDKINAFRTTGVAGTGALYTGTIAAMTKAELEAGYPVLIFFTPHVDSVGAFSININGGAARLCRTQDDAPPVSGQLRAGVRYLLIYEGTRLYIVGEFAGVNRLVKQSQIDALQSNLGLINLTGVAGTASLYTATCPIARTVVEDGSARFMYFIPHVTCEPDVNGWVRLAISDDTTTPNLIRTMDDTNPVKGQLVAGKRYILLAQSNKYFVLGERTISSAALPSTDQVADRVLASSSQFAAAYIEKFRHGASMAPDEMNTLALPNETGPLMIGAQANGKNIACVRTGQEYDLAWMKPGTKFSLHVKNAANNASCRLTIPAGASVFGPAQSNIYTVPNNSVIDVELAQLTTSLLTLSLVARHGSIATSAGAAVARARGIIMAGQSLGLRFCQGYGPMALEKAFSDAGLTASTRLINVAAGSSSLFYANDNSGAKDNHWWDERTDTAGPLALAAVAIINAHLASKPAGEPAPQMMYFIIGQNDADNINTTGTTTIATVRAHFRKVIAYIRTNTGLTTLKTCIDLLGSDDGGAYTHGQCSMFRLAQLRACLTDVNADDPLIRPGIETYDLVKPHDDVHLTLLSQELQAQRYVDLWRTYVDGTAGVAKQGVEIISHVASSPSVHVIRTRTSTGFGVRRPVQQVPTGIAFLPNAVPTPNDTPYTIRSWRELATGVANELEFEFTLVESDANAKCVTNWGKGTPGGFGELLRDILTMRGCITRDVRPIV